MPAHLLDPSGEVIAHRGGKTRVISGKKRKARRTTTWRGGFEENWLWKQGRAGGNCRLRDAYGVGVTKEQGALMPTFGAALGVVGIASYIGAGLQVCDEWDSD